MRVTMKFRNKSAALVAAILTLATALFTSSSTVLGDTMTPVSVQPKLETPSNFDDDAGGNADADDPAIWVHPFSPSKSLVVATLKNAGLAVYDLKGVQLQSIAAPPAPTPNDSPGRFNNVDLLYSFVLNNQKVDLAVVSDRGSDKLRIYSINPQAASSDQPPLTDVTTANVPFIFSSSQTQVNEQATAYGLAVYRDPKSGRSFAYVSQRNRTAIAVVELLQTSQGQITYRNLKQINLPSKFELPNGTSWTPCEDPGELPQVEGMVVDQKRGILYAGQEDVGIWKIKLSLGSTRPILLDKVREFGVPYTYDSVEEECKIDFNNDPGYGGKNLSADVEGLTIYYANDNEGYLLASSQGDNTFAVYEREGNNRFVGSFALVDTTTVDGVQESDGAAVINVPLDREFPLGLFVTQDGENTPEVLDDAGEVRANTNFKFIPWQSIANTFPKPLQIKPDGWNPRDDDD